MMMKKKLSHIAVITSRFNEAITSQLKASALKRLKERGIAPQQITVIDVPGAIEIPLIAKQCAKKGIYHAVICLGAVIRGETSHYDYVCKQVSDGCQQVMMQYNIPVIFGVLTTNNEAQAQARVDQSRDAVDAALEMVTLIDSIRC